MANPYDPFGLGKRKPEDPKTGPNVPNMGGIPATPLSPAANLNPFAIPPVAGDKGGRPSVGGVAPSPIASPMNAAASPVQPPTEAAPAPEGAPREDISQEGIRDRKNNQGVTINIGGEGQKPAAAAAGAPTPSESGGMAVPQAGGPVPGLPAPIKLDRFPTEAEMAFAPQGTVMETHVGAMTRGADGNWNLQPNEVGIQKYKMAKVKKLQRFGGYPLAGSPGAPLPPVEPGQPAFQPFTGIWVE